VKRYLAAVVVCVSLSVAASAPALAKPFPASIPLPNDFAPEGIAIGAGSTFYAGSLVTGDIYRGSLRSGEGAIFIDAPDGRVAVGLKADRARRLLLLRAGRRGRRTSTTCARAPTWRPTSSPLGERRCSTT
jgi:hypothetical protein